MNSTYHFLRFVDLFFFGRRPFDYVEADLDVKCLCRTYIILLAVLARF